MGWLGTVDVERASLLKSDKQCDIMDSLIKSVVKPSVIHIVATRSCKSFRFVKSPLIVGHKTWQPVCSTFLLLLTMAGSEFADQEGERGWHWGGHRGMAAKCWHLYSNTVQYYMFL